MLQLPALLYSYDALEPFLSKEQVRVHYEEHHAKYYTTLNALIGSVNELSLESIVMQFDTRNKVLYNNAGQAYNHDLFWQCLSPNGGGQPSGTLLEAINTRFGNLETFKRNFIFAAANHFGSGWCWLTSDKSGRIDIQTTENAGCLLSDKVFPLMTLDLWEHAFYISYRADKQKYFQGFFDKINWHFIERRFQRGVNNQ